MKRPAITRTLWVVIAGLIILNRPAVIFGIEGPEASENHDLGRIASPDLDRNTAGIQECGLTTWVKQKWTYTDVKTKGNNLVFTANAREIIWFAQFNIQGMMKNDISRKYRIQWISPDGKIYREEKFKSSLWNESFIKRSIKFNSTIEKPYIGRWRVRVWKKDSLIDDRFFEIAKR